MKIISIIILLLVTTSCGQVFEDMSHCPPEGNVKLHFRYITGDSGDIFSANVFDVKVAIFDDSDYFVMLKTLSKSNLYYFQGVMLNLLPGTYRIVCWGNVSNNIDYPDLTGKNLSEVGLTHVRKNIGWSENGERLFYAPKINDIDNPETTEFTIIVPDNTMAIEQEINFTAAHNTLEVYIKGVPVAPLVTIDKVAQKYNFRMQPSDNLMRYVQTAQVMPGSNNLLSTRFYIPQFRNDNHIMINLSFEDQIGLHNWDISLKQFLEENDITVDPTAHNLIQIEIEYKNGIINVNLPDWKDIIVDPEI